jgi:hypothetical protein
MKLILVLNFNFNFNFKSTKARLHDLHENHSKLEWEHEILTQRFESVSFACLRFF